MPSPLRTGNNNHPDRRGHAGPGARARGPSLISPAPSAVEVGSPFDVRVVGAAHIVGALALHACWRSPARVRADGVRVTSRWCVSIINLSFRTSDFRSSRVFIYLFLHFSLSLFIY